MMDRFLTLAADPVAHVVNHKATEIDGWWVWSGHMGNLLLSAIIMVVAGLYAASRIATGPESLGSKRYLPRGTFPHVVEVICVYLREQTVRPMLGERTDRFMPLLWTLFFFILVNNLLGLVPLLDIHAWATPELVLVEHKAWIGGTLTQNIFVTGVLAFVAFLVVNVAGIRALGIGGYLKHLTGGAPVFVWPILIPVEVAGIFIKPVALCIRLFANMTAGHILVATLLGFIGLALSGELGMVLGGTVTVVAGIGVVAIYFLELFVAFLQAFVFMFLTSVFISLLAHHDDEHGHDHEHAPGAHPAHA
ncbi:MAG: F0F1 ATP synthase subunit A [Phycisphaerales bacterium]